MSARPHSFTSVTIEVEDPVAASLFYQYHVGLEEVRVDGDERFLRCGLDHHSVHLVRRHGVGSARVAAVAYSVETAEGLANLARSLEDAGHRVDEIRSARARHALDGFETVDPNGLTVQIVHEPFVFAEPPSSAFAPVEMVHPFLWTDRYEASEHFYVDVLGFRPSDYIERKLVFLRGADRWHHSLALLKSDSFTVAHLCFLMPSLEDVMRGRARAMYRGVELPVDLVKHSASESIAVYLHDPRFGPWIELCDSHRRLTAEEDDHDHRPRRMADDPRNVMDVWRASADHDWRAASAPET